MVGMCVSSDLKLKFIVKAKFKFSATIQYVHLFSFLQVYLFTYYIDIKSITHKSVVPELNKERKDTTCYEYWILPVLSTKNAHSFSRFLELIFPIYGTLYILWSEEYINNVNYSMNDKLLWLFQGIL